MVSNRLWKMIAVVALLLVVAGSHKLYQFASGIISSKEIEEIEKIKKSADQGNTLAQADIGSIIATENGRGNLSTDGWTKDHRFNPKLSPAYEYYNTLVAKDSLEEDFYGLIKHKKETALKMMMNENGKAIGTILFIFFIIFWYKKFRKDEQKYKEDERKRIEKRT